MSALRLAVAYLWFQRVRSLLLVVCVLLVVLLPATVQILIQEYETQLRRRAAETPLVVGAKGSRFDLLLSSLYFRGDPRELTDMAEVERLRASENVDAIPLHFPHRVRFSDASSREERVVVGTEFDYFDFRQLRVAEGEFHARWGQAIVGANVAKRWGVRPGDKITSKVGSTFDLASIYPLRMTVTGVLAPSGTADDEVIFVDIWTSWIISGIGHGHQDVTPELDPSLVLEQSEHSITTSTSIFEYNEITEENIDRFHFHSEPDELPVSAAIVLPRDFDSGVKAKVHVDLASDSVQIIEPRQTLDEFMEIVFRVKRFFDLNFGLVLVATLVFFAVVVLLSIKVRERELRTLARIGCRRGKIVQILGLEYLLIIGSGLLVAAVAAYGLSRWAITLL